MPKMRGFLRTKEKIDDAEWAIAQIRTAARLEDLFSPDEAQASKQAEAGPEAGATTGEAAPILVGPGPWPGGPRPPIIVVGVSDVVSVLPQDRRVEPVPVMDESIGARVETKPAEQPYVPIIIGAPAPAASTPSEPVQADRARPRDAAIDLVPVMSVGQVRPAAKAAEPAAKPIAEPVAPAPRPRADASGTSEALPARPIGLMVAPGSDAAKDRWHPAKPAAPAKPRPDTGRAPAAYAFPTRPVPVIPPTAIAPADAESTAGDEAPTEPAIQVQVEEAVLVAADAVIVAPAEARAEDTPVVVEATALTSAVEASEEAASAAEEVADGEPAAAIALGPVARLAARLEPVEARLEPIEPVAMEAPAVETLAEEPTAEPAAEPAPAPAPAPILVAGSPIVGRSATGRFTARVGGTAGGTAGATTERASSRKASTAGRGAARRSTSKAGAPRAEAPKTAAPKAFVEKAVAPKAVAEKPAAAKPVAKAATRRRTATSRPAVRAASTGTAVAKTSSVRRAAARPAQARRPSATPMAAGRAAVEPASTGRRRATTTPGGRATAKPAHSAPNRRTTAKAASAGRTAAQRVIPAAHCPYCALLLDPAPTLNRRCDRCRQKIVVRHVDGHAVFLTEGAVAVFEAERERIANLAGWTRQRDRWLTLAASAGAAPERQSQLAKARLTEAVVNAARSLYMTTVDKTVRAAKRENRWDEASRIRREQAAAMYRVAGAPRPLPADLVAAFSDAVAAELRGIAEISRDAELVAANCCETCRADDGVIVRISQELRAPRLPHAGCPRGLCRCRWDLAARDRRKVSRYMRRRPGAGSRSGQEARVEAG